jgi:hydroxymethylpyrimidine pyrophosphatase-like HAD family hydrolase
VLRVQIKLEAYTKLSPYATSQHFSTMERKNEPPASNAIMNNRTTGPEYAVYPSIVAKVLSAQNKNLIKVLFCDIDATLLLGTGHSPEEIETSHTVCRELINGLNRDGVIIIPVTGGHFDRDTATTSSILTRIKNGVLPSLGTKLNNMTFQVDAYVSDGGAHATYADVSGVHLYDRAYHRHVHPKNLNFENLLTIATRLSQTLCISSPLSINDVEKIKKYDNTVKFLRVFQQPGTEHGTDRESNKIAYHFYASTLAQRDQIYEAFHIEMEPHGLEVVCCEEKDANTHARRLFSTKADTDGFPLKYCVDISAFTKGSAVEYFADYIKSLIMSEENLNTPEIEIWACGDSGNDLPLMMSPSVTHTVIVGGASAELTRMEPQIIEHGKSVYTELDFLRLGPASIVKALFASNNLR